MKKLYVCFLIVLLFISGCSLKEQKLANAYCVSYDENINYTYEDINFLKNNINEQLSIMDSAHKMAESARELNYTDNHYVVLLAKTEYERAESIMNKYKLLYDNLVERWSLKEEEYPIAAYIWDYLKEKGYSKEIRAGILGNIMCEAGGNTLDIQWDILSSDNYYGICQWNKSLYSEVFNCSLDEQLEYLVNNMPNEFDSFGHLYKKNFSYNNFISLSSIYEVSLSFAKCYERCGGETYELRYDCALIAYNYFVS